MTTPLPDSFARSNRLDWLKAELDRLRQGHLLRKRRTRESPPVAGLVQIDGRQCINFGSNDYLGIAASSKLVAAVQAAIGQVGFGSGASPVVHGYGTLHRALERDIAAFECTDSAILFPTGYAANVGAICSLVSKGDVVFSDQLNHASIIDGCRLSGARVEIYPHADTSALRQLLVSSTFGRKLIVTDGLFSMDGDLAPLPELCLLADTYDAMLLVDEAHATGVIGATGRGAGELLECEHQIDVRVGTLSKALGCFGGFVAGRRDLIDWIFNRARTYLFSTAQPEILAAAARTAIQLVIDEPQRRNHLLQLSDHLRARLIDHKFDIGNSQSHIVPIIVGQSEAALAISDQLMNDGFFVPAIRPPSVPADAARLRISLCSSHQSEHVDKLVDSLVRIRR